jgi:hypothetical protein
MDAENKLENESDKAPNWGGYLELGALKLYVTHQPIKILLKEAEVQTTTDKSNLTTILIRIYI